MTAPLARTPSAAVACGATPLPQLAAHINEAHAQADRASREANRANREAVMHALRAGAGLIEAKQRVPHGEWLPWLKGNIDGSVRTAQQYMQLAREPGKSADLAHLGIVAIAAALAKPKPKPKPPRRPAPEPHPVGIAEGPLHAEGELPQRLSALARKAFLLALGPDADRAVALAEPHEREVVQRHRAQLIQELQILVNRALSNEPPDDREPWALVNNRPASVDVFVPPEYGTGTLPLHIRPGQRAPEKWA